MNRDFSQKHSVFFENLSRKVLAHINYADLIDESLAEVSVKPLVAEAIEKKELEKLEQLAQEASKDVEETIATASGLGFKNTVKYLEGLKGDLPGTFTLVKLAFGGDPKKAAEEIGKVTSVTSKLNLARDSFNDAIALFGTELAKLPFAKEESWESFREKNTDEDGKLTIEGEWNAVSLDELMRTVREDPLIDVIKMAQKEKVPLASLEFPDESLLRKAAENSYKPPPDPKGMWGKLVKFFGMGDLSAGQFADDVMQASLTSLIEKAKEMEAAKAETEADAQETAAAMGEIEKDLQQLGQGDTSVVAGTAPGAADQKAAQQTVINMPDMGKVPVTSQSIQQIAPGFDQAPEKVADKKMVPIPELERQVTAPEEVAEITPELAALINDDPKSNVIFFDPEEAKKAAEEAEKEKPAGDATAAAANETWVHTRPIKDWLFESSATKRKTHRWVHERSLSQTLFSESIFYKDVAKALKTQGIEDEKLDDYARELSKRLKNQYDVIIEDIPEIEITPEDEKAAEEIQQTASGMSGGDVKDLVSDILNQVGEMNKTNASALTAIMQSRDESERERAIARANEQGLDLTVVATASAEAAASAEVGATGEEAEEEEAPGGEKPKKERKKGPPSEKMTDRGKEVGLEPKEGESGEGFGKRVRREEEKQGKRTKKKKEPKAEPKTKPKAKTGASSKASASAEAKSEAFWHKGHLLHTTLYHKLGTLSEMLLGSQPKNNDLIDPMGENPVEGTDQSLERWTKLAGLEED